MSMKMKVMLFRLMLLVRNDCAGLSSAFVAFDTNADCENQTKRQSEVLDEVNKSFVSLLQLKSDLHANPRPLSEATGLETQRQVVIFQCSYRVLLDCLDRAKQLLYSIESCF